MNPGSFGLAQVEYIYKRTRGKMVQSSVYGSRGRIARSLRQFARSTTQAQPSSAQVNLVMRYLSNGYDDFVMESNSDFEVII